MARKQKPPEGGGGAPEWMTTYGDLVTLLMCFFVLLFAFSTIDKQKFVAVMQSFQGSAGVLQSGQSLSPSDLVFDGMPESKETLDQESIQQKKEVEELEEALENFKKENNLDVDFKIEAEERGLKITFPDNALFDPGSADLKEQSLIILEFFSDLLNEDVFAGRYVRIEGHTDNVPINTLRFPSNWELSAIRATTVLRYFTEVKGMSNDRFSVVGYGEYKPVTSNDTAEGRAQNRRVDIVVLTEEEAAKEPSN